MSRSSVLIVGANGFLGARSVACFLAAGHDVHCFGPAPAVDLLAPWRGRITERVGSVTDAACLADAVGAARPDVVISFAAHGEGRQGLMRSGEAAPDLALAVNVGGFRTLLDVCAQAGVARVLWASSTTVFGPAQDYPGVVDEDAPCRPRTVYGLTKQLAEEVALFYRRRGAPEVCALRPPLVFGPGRWYGGAAEALDRMLRAAARRERIALTVPSGRFDLMHGDDVARAFLHLARHPGPLPPCYHLNGFATSYREIAAVLAAAAPGFAAELHESAGADPYPLISAARITAETGFRPVFDAPATMARVLQEIAP